MERVRGTHSIECSVVPSAGLICVKEGIFLLISAIKIRFLGHPARTLVAIPTELTRLFISPAFAGIYYHNCVHPHITVS
jgi:hypothetical protein